MADAAPFADSVSYADVALPVPLDQAFTYEVPVTMRHRVRAGCRVSAPFGGRSLTGVVVRVHPDRPGVKTRSLTQLLDEEPVLDEALLSLGEWTARYYCAPLGEVLRAMTPVSAEVRRSRTYALTAAGLDVARQLTLVAASDDQAAEVLRLLEARPLTALYLAKRVARAAAILRDLERRGYVESRQEAEQRDVTRAPANQLAARFVKRAEAGVKLKKAERETLSFLELHPGSHGLPGLEEAVKGGTNAARALARMGLAAVDLVERVAEEDRPRHELNVHQAEAYAAVSGAIAAGMFQTFLLQGVTGSGKTEVYLRCIEACLEAGRTALLLVPEIGLTPGVAAQFQRRFEGRVAILHSAFSDLERAGQWRRIRAGEATVIIGTRSGVFAPVQNLGLILVDEEHDHSYKQGETPRYHGRDLAIVRAQNAGAVIVLGSATPSLESRQNADLGKYRLLRLPERVERRPLPEVELVDMRTEFLETRRMETFSRRLKEEIQTRLDSGEQTVLLHNRRGFSSVVQCRGCGWRMDCKNCSISLTFHRRDRRCLCHYCGYQERQPERCPECGADYVQFLGTGTEKVEHELHEAFPGARIARLDRDTASGKQRFEEILSGFRNGEFDILTGTQMIAKGHDIPRVTLVGVINADIGLTMPDFRAAERCFQLLTQVAGRAGRGDLAGRVLMQTLNPDHYAIRFAAAQDYEGFYAREIEFRRALRYPPYAALANVLVRHEDLELAQRITGEVGLFFQRAREGMKVLGPAAAAVPRLKSEHRFQCLVKANSRQRLNEALQQLRRHALEQKWPAASLVIDVDPVSLL